MENTYTKYIDLIISSLMTATILFTSVLWYDVIEITIDDYFPMLKGKSLKGKLLFAIIVSFIVVLMHIYLFPELRKYFTNDSKSIKNDTETIDIIDTPSYLPIERIR
jgi:hypothetical protein